MSTESELVVLVTALAGGQDVVGGDDLNVGQDIQSGGDVGTAGELGEVGLAQFLSNANSGDIRTFGARRRAKGGGDGTGDVIVNDSTDRTSTTGKSRLQTEITAATRDESNVTSQGGRVVRCFTSKVAHGDQRRTDETSCGVGVLEEVGLDCLAINGEAVDRAVQHHIVGERLKGDIVI